MRYISVFSGIEAASAAWAPLGWEPVAFSEIEPFPCAVLEHRFPGVPNLGDITEVDWSPYSGSVDVVVGGSPCQSFSVAGGREGLDGESRLMYEYIRCVQDVSPRWLLWENVPGVLSIDAGRAFGILLHEVAELGYSLAWRVLEAQFFGVAQRRRRVFLVGHLGEGLAPAAVLFEPESVRGDHPTSREKREALASRAGTRPSCAGFCAGAAAGAGGVGFVPEQHPTLKAGSNLAATGAVVQAIGFSWHNGGNTALSIGETSPTVGSNMQPACAIAQNQRGELRADGTDGQTVGAIPATRSGKQLQAVWCRMDDNAFAPTDVCGALCASDGPRGVSGQYAYDGKLVLSRAARTVAVRCGKDGGGKGALVSDDVSLTLSTQPGAALFQPEGCGYAVRRLTPLECERLQGFDDGWTDIPYKGRDRPPDSPRYKALGNSMAVPVMRWIGERIEVVDEISEGE